MPGPSAAGSAWTSPTGGPAATLVWNWLAVALLAGYVWRVERLGPDSLRLVRPSEKDLEWGGYLGGAAVLWHWLSSRLLPASATESEAVGGQETLVALGPLLAFALVVTTAFTEEILWRGYAVERAAAWIGPVVASLIGLAVFVVPHVTFFGAGWLVTNLPGAVAVYVLLLWRRNLWACILCHAVTNIPLVVAALIT